MKIAILRERKIPPESRVPLTPKQAAFLRDELDIDIVVESSPDRCFPDQSYRDLGVPVVEDIQDCEVLMGVKEVPVAYLLPGKTYLIFSHTVKKQAYNRPLLQEVMKAGITLIDYELLTNTHGDRLIAFGHFAGMVGAHNALWTWGQRTGAFDLPRLKDLPDYAAAKEVYASLKLPPVKIVLTGTGRVGTGALLTLKDMGIKQVDAEDYLHEHYAYPVFTQLMPHHYAASKDGDPFDKSAFYNNPSEFESTFWPYARVSDIMINGIYWVPEAPAFFTLASMQDPDFHIRVIADISCDITPVASIPSTIRATTIEDPVYGFDPRSGREVAPHLPDAIDMMTIDNLPNEVPREASKAFGKQFITKILGELMKGDPSELLERATITEHGHLKPAFEFLQAWVEGRE